MIVAGPGDHGVDLFGGWGSAVPSIIKCKGNGSSLWASLGIHTISLVVSGNFGAAEALFGCKPRSAWGSICLSRPTMVTLASELCDQAWMTTGVFGSVIFFCGIRVTTLHLCQKTCHASQTVGTAYCALLRRECTQAAVSGTQRGSG